jgi:hypothetical protein
MIKAASLATAVMIASSSAQAQSTLPIAGGSSATLGYSDMMAALNACREYYYVLRTEANPAHYTNPACDVVAKAASDAASIPKPMSDADRRAMIASVAAKIGAGK